MKQEIIDNIENPVILEKLYRDNQTEFTLNFNELYSEIKTFPIAQFWNVRLLEEKNHVAYADNFEETGDNSLSKQFKLYFTVIAAFVCGTIIKFPDMIGYNFQNFITDNGPFILFPALALFYLLKYKADSKKYVFIYSIVLVSAIFMNILPWLENSDTRILSAIHFSVITWILLGAAYINFDFTSRKNRMMFLKRNGDMFILTGVILCAGMLLIMLTVGMFKVIEVRIDWFLEKYVVVYGLVSAPLLANYMIESSPKIINKVAPFISKLFTPLMLILMTCFLSIMVFFGKNPFNNREELIVFNVLLTVIMAVIVFSFSGNSADHKSVYNKILLVLSLEAIIINIIALSAIIYRLFSFGISPNRIAVIGANVLLFSNLILLTLKLIQFIRNKTSPQNVEKSMAQMLPVYAVWAIVVSVFLPFFFSFK
ncbi:MAG: hypothetical protein ABI543_02960 [Ignavibacteria bacterium]